MIGGNQLTCFLYHGDVNCYIQRVSIKVTDETPESFEVPPVESKKMIDALQWMQTIQQFNRPNRPRLENHDRIILQLTMHSDKLEISDGHTPSSFIDCITDGEIKNETKPTTLVDRKYLLQFNALHSFDSYRSILFITVENHMPLRLQHTLVEHDILRADMESTLKKNADLLLLCIPTVIHKMILDYIYSSSSSYIRVCIAPRAKNNNENFKNFFFHITHIFFDCAIVIYKSSRKKNGSTSNNT